MTETKAHRKKHADLHHSLSIKALAAQIPAGFNPLAPAPVQKKNDSGFIEKEMRDMIKQDVDRTLQEHNYFLQKKNKDVLSECLFLWGRENPEY